MAMPVTAAFNSLMGNSFYWVHFLCPCIEREGCEMERPGRRHKCQWVKFIWGDRLHNQQSSWGHRLGRERPWKASQIFWYMYLKWVGIHWLDWGRHKGGGGGHACWQKTRAMKPPGTIWGLRSCEYGMNAQRLWATCIRMRRWELF